MTYYNAIVPIPVRRPPVRKGESGEAWLDRCRTLVFGEHADQMVPTYTYSIPDLCWILKVWVKGAFERHTHNVMYGSREETVRFYGMMTDESVDPKELSRLGRRIWWLFLWLAREPMLKLLAEGAA